MRNSRIADDTPEPSRRPSRLPQARAEISPTAASRPRQCTEPPPPPRLLARSGLDHEDKSRRPHWDTSSSCSAASSSSIDPDHGAVLSSVRSSRGSLRGAVPGRCGGRSLTSYVGVRSDVARPSHLGFLGSLHEVGAAFGPSRVRVGNALRTSD